MNNKLTNKEKKIEVKFRLTLRKEDNFFGPGVSDLLHNIDKYNSIQKSCEEMGLSYQKAWHMLRYAQKQLKFKLIDAKSGGANGGNSFLTKECKDFLQKYDNMVEEINIKTNELFKKYFEKL